ncbi:DUF4192 family protein [Kitasatospora sp. NPDC088779]|uniref:DUF4192 family protein n=1 Tax=unclassified Kitasatospora TaxID=2633591 RepID=UPI00342DAB42
MSENTPFTIEAADLADFAAGAFGREPARQIVFVEFGEPLRMIVADIPQDPHHWPSFARAFIGDVAELPPTSTGQRGIALLVYARAGHGPEAIEWYTALWRHLAAACARYGLAVIESQFITPTHWWPLPADTSCGNPGPGTPRTVDDADRPTVDPHVVGGDDQDGGGVVADALRFFAEELEAGGEAVIRDLEPVLDAVLTGRRGVDTLTEPEAARLLLAVQNGEVLHLASTYCEPGEVKRARWLWARIARLCTGRHRRLAAAPLTLLGTALMLDGDLAAAEGAAVQALEAKPGDEDAQALLGLVALAEVDQVIGAPVGVPDSLRAVLREQREG